MKGGLNQLAILYQYYLAPNLKPKSRVASCNKLIYEVELGHPFSSNRALVIGSGKGSLCKGFKLSPSRAPFDDHGTARLVMKNNEWLSG